MNRLYELSVVPPVLLPIDSLHRPLYHLNLDLLLVRSSSFLSALLSHDGFGTANDHKRDSGNLIWEAHPNLDFSRSHVQLFSQGLTSRYIRFGRFFKGGFEDLELRSGSPTPMLDTAKHGNHDKMIAAMLNGQGHT